MIKIIYQYISIQLVALLQDSLWTMISKQSSWAVQASQVPITWTTLLYSMHIEVFKIKREGGKKGEKKKEKTRWLASVVKAAKYNGWLTRVMCMADPHQNKKLVQ